jgi:hypothetical protein
MLIEFNPEDKFGRLSFGVVYDRLYSFFMRHNISSDKHEIVKLIMKRVLDQDPRLKILLDVDKEGFVKGHALMDLQQELDRQAVYVHQCEIDPGNKTQFGKEVIEYATKWGLLNNCYKIMMATRRNPDVWKRAYGFKVDMWIMSKPITTEEPDNAIQT